MPPIQIAKLSSQLTKIAESTLTPAHLERMKSLHAQISILLRDAEVELSARAKPEAEGGTKRRRSAASASAVRGGGTPSAATRAHTSAHAPTPEKKFIAFKMYGM